MALKNDEDAFHAISMAEDQIPEQYKGYYNVAKGLYTKPSEALEALEVVEKSAESYVPQEYKGLFNSGLKVFDKAQELKEQKDAMQRQMFEKAIEPVWEKYDTKKVGSISKDQCQEMVTGALEQLKMSRYFNQFAFDKIFE